MRVPRSVSAPIVRFIAISFCCLLFAINGSPVAGAAETPATQDPSHTHLTFNPPCPMVNETVTLTASVLGLASGTGLCQREP